MTRNARHVPTLVAALVLSACASAGSGPSYPDVSGTWTGGIEVQGQAIDGTLQIVQAAQDLTGTFASPTMGVSADGTGVVTAEGEVRMTLQYDMQCPGTAEMIGALTADGTGLSGVLEAVDCTGEISGTFDFRR